MESSNNNQAHDHNPSLQEQLNLQQEALAKIYVSVEKTRKYIFWTTVANLVLFILPLIVVAIAFPFIMNTFTSSLGAFTESPSSQQTIPEPSLSESLQNLHSLFN